MTALRTVSQASYLLSLLEVNDTAKLAGFWTTVPAADDRSRIAEYLSELVTAAVVNMPAERRAAELAQRDQLFRAALSSKSPARQAVRLERQAQHTRRIIAEAMPDPRARLARYRAGVEAYARSRSGSIA